MIYWGGHCSFWIGSAVILMRGQIVCVGEWMAVLENWFEVVK
jgi:hypothetical protein